MLAPGARHVAGVVGNVPPAVAVDPEEITVSGLIPGGGGAAHPIDPPLRQNSLTVPNAALEVSGAPVRERSERHFTPMPPAADTPRPPCLPCSSSATLTGITQIGPHRPMLVGNIRTDRRRTRMNFHGDRGTPIASELGRRVHGRSAFRFPRRYSPPRATETSHPSVTMHARWCFSRPLPGIYTLHCSSLGS
jgi:hypothetical protein